MGPTTRPLRNPIITPGGTGTPRTHPGTHAPGGAASGARDHAKSVSVPRPPPCPLPVHPPRAPSASWSATLRSLVSTLLFSLTPAPLPWIEVRPETWFLTRDHRPFRAASTRCGCLTGTSEECFHVLSSFRDPCAGPENHSCPVFRPVGGHATSHTAISGTAWNDRERNCPIGERRTNDRRRHRHPPGGPPARHDQ